MCNGLQLYTCMVNIFLFHLVLHFLSLQSKETALHLASGWGRDKVCQVLLQAGANIHATDNVSTTTTIISLTHLLHVKT